MYGPAKHAVGPFRVPTAYQSHLNVISLLHPGPGPDCPLTRMLGLELMSTRAFHPAHGQTMQSSFVNSFGEAFVYIYIYRERQRDSETERQRDRETDRVTERVREGENEREQGETHNCPELLSPVEHGCRNRPWHAAAPSTARSGDKRRPNQTAKPCATPLCSTPLCSTPLCWSSGGVPLHMPRPKCNHLFTR